MKFLDNLVKRIEIIAFLLGFIVAARILFFPAKYFIAWHALPKSPEPVVEIISTNHMGDVIVQTISNKKFACDIYDEKECWIELDANFEPLNLGKTLCFLEDCPNQHIVQMTTASNASHGLGRVATRYSLHDDGSVYVNQVGVVEWLGCIAGILVGGFFACIAAVSKPMFLGLSSLFRGDRDKAILE